MVAMYMSMQNTSRHWSCLFHYLCLCLFVGPVFSPHHTNQIEGENHICTVLYISMATVVSPTPPGTGLVFVFVFSLSLSGGNCTCTMLYISMTTVLGSTPPGTGLFFVFSLSFPCIFFVFSIYSLCIFLVVVRWELYLHRVVH